MDTEGNTSLPQKYKGRFRVGGVVVCAGSARRSAGEDIEVSAEELDCGYNYAVGQEGQSRLRRTYTTNVLCA